MHIDTYHRRSTGTVSVLHASCVTATVHQTRFCRFAWHRGVRKCIPKLILASSARTGCQVKVKLSRYMPWRHMEGEEV
jgi:hypothetical protein